MYFFLSLVTLSSPAAVFYGNPKASFKVDRPEGDYIDGSVYVYALRVTNCSGTETSYAVKQWVDPVAGYTLTINGGDLCEATWEWDSDFEINGPGYSLGASPTNTTFDLEHIIPVRLQPYEVDSGSYTGHPPFVLMTLN